MRRWPAGLLLLLLVAACSAHEAPQPLCWRSESDALWFAHRVCVRDATCRFAVRPPRLVPVPAALVPTPAPPPVPSDHPLARLYAAHLGAVRPLPGNLSAPLGGPALDAWPLAWRAAPSAYASVVWWHAAQCTESGAATLPDDDAHWTVLMRTYAPLVAHHLVAAYVARSGLLTAGSVYCAGGAGGTEAVLSVTPTDDANGTTLVGVDCLCSAGTRCGGGTVGERVTLAASTSAAGVDSGDDSDVPLSERSLVELLAIAILAIMGVGLLLVLVVVAYAQWDVWRITRRLRRLIQRRPRHAS